MTEEELALEICRAWGFEHIISLSINMRANTLFTATVEFYPGKEKLEKIVPILKKFKLCPIEEVI